jgi:hypothetical protein
MLCLMSNFFSLESALAFVDVLSNLVPYSKIKNVFKAGEFFLLFSVIFNVPQI